MAIESRLKHKPIPSAIQIKENHSKWPEDGPHAFTKAESAWLSGTLSLLKHGAGRLASTRRLSAPPADPLPPPPPAKPTPRDSSKAQRRQGASPKTRDADPVRSASRFLNYTLIIYPLYDIHTFYDTHYDDSLSCIHQFHPWYSQRRYSA